MSMMISPISDLAEALPSEARPNPQLAVREVNATDFGDVLTGVVARAAALGHDATARTEALARGTSDDLHGTMIAGQKADITLKLVGTIRNKLLDAFHEIWRTSV